MEKQPQIVIGTPGRMKDMFIKDNVLRLDTAKIVVIDEADMTLEFGFLEDIDEILSKMDKKVQMMVFSATIPESLQPFLKKYLYDPEFINNQIIERFKDGAISYKRIYTLKSGSYSRQEEWKSLAPNINIST